MTLVKVNNQVTKTLDGFINEIMHDFPANLGKTFREGSLNFPPVNITENSHTYQLEVAAPGLAKTDFNIQLDGNLLTISADKKAAANEDQVKIIRKEFSTKAFKRSFTLDEKINAASIVATYEIGILTLLLPKKEVVKVTSKEITVQ